MLEDRRTVAMTLVRPFLAAALAAGLFAFPALADGPRDQDRAYRAAASGEALTYPELKERIQPYMGDATPLGPDIRGRKYLVKFLSGGRLIWVEVDPATGRILGRTR